MILYDSVCCSLVIMSCWLFSLIELAISSTIHLKIDASTTDPNINNWRLCSEMISYVLCMYELCVMSCCVMSSWTGSGQGKLSKEAEIPLQGLITFKYTTCIRHRIVIQLAYDTALWWSMFVKWLSSNWKLVRTIIWYLCFPNRSQGDLVSRLCTIHICG